jgi:CubicO group peptidase (beta-lactamase class C family)
LTRKNEKSPNAVRLILATAVTALLILPAALGRDDQGAPQTTVDDLPGLWKAQRWFGPYVRGTLTIQKRGEAYSADIAGLSVAVRRVKDELLFELPDGQGSFRGHVENNGNITGHWISPRYIGYGFQYASPIHFKLDGTKRWSGQVVPLNDTFTLYLLLKAAPDGSMTVILQNPERDYGAFIGADRLVREGSALKLMGKRQNWKEERVVATGSYDADNKVVSLYFSDRGGTYDFQRDGDSSGFYPRGRDAHYLYSPPLARDDGWVTASLDAVDIDRAGIERFVQKVVDTPMDSADAPQVQTILIARHGKLVLDEYFHGFSRDTLSETRSAGKSITATLIGAAMHAGALLSLSSRVYEVMNGRRFPDGLDPRKRAMTLKNLMNMSSGFDCDDANPDTPGFEDAMYDSDAKDYYRYALALPMAFEPGEKAVYCTQDPNLALGMLGRATGEYQLSVFDRLVAAPLDIDRYDWLLDPAGNPFGGGSVKILPRDFLKFGQLMMDCGVWHGHRILGREFAAAAVSPLYNMRNVTYGYFWWGIDYPYKNRTVRAFYAGGAGGQTVISIPALDLVIGVFAGNYSSKAWKDVAMNYVPRYILPAVREVGDDKSAPIAWREDYTTPYGHSESSGPVVAPH